jgi:uncharacterized protein with LGFP repeats
VTDVIGAIRDKWLALGGAGGLGDPLDVERPTFDGQGRTQPFSRGIISWHPELGAFGVWGDIGAKWVAVGREQYGYPLTDELMCPDGRGRFNHFRTMQIAGRPEASIYWTPSTGANEVHGAIRTEWASRGWERGPLGYPTSDEHGRKTRVYGRRSDFEHGYIEWSPQGGVQVHGPVRIDD